MVHCQRCNGIVATNQTDDREADYTHESTCMSCGEITYHGVRVPWSESSAGITEREVIQKEMKRRYWSRRKAAGR